MTLLCALVATLSVQSACCPQKRRRRKEVVCTTALA